jgi:hypothetical protein
VIQATIAANAVEWLREDHDYEPHLRRALALHLDPFDPSPRCPLIATFADEASPLR